MADTWGGSWGASWDVSWTLGDSITGTGTLVCQSSTMSATGIGGSTGTGVLETQSSALDGEGHTRWVATGSLLSGSSDVEGAGEVTGEGTPADPIRHYIDFDPIPITHRQEGS